MKLTSRKISGLRPSEARKNLAAVFAEWDRKVPFLLNNHLDKDFSCHFESVPASKVVNKLDSEPFHFLCALPSFDFLLEFFRTRHSGGAINLAGISFEYNDLSLCDPSILNRMIAQNLASVGRVFVHGYLSNLKDVQVSYSKAFSPEGMYSGFASCALNEQKPYMVLPSFLEWCIVNDLVLYNYSISACKKAYGRYICNLITKYDGMDFCHIDSLCLAHIPGNLISVYAAGVEEVRMRLLGL